MAATRAGETARGDRTRRIGRLIRFQAPDLRRLVAVWATNGRIGYAYARDLTGPEPANPEEAATWTPAPPHTIPVYEADGLTVIGEFPVGG